MPSKSILMFRIGFPIHWIPNHIIYDLFMFALIPDHTLIIISLTILEFSQSHPPGEFVWLLRFK